MGVDNSEEMLNRITPQWIAGFFDGEGHIHVRLEKDSDNVIIDVGITQKDINVLSLIYAKYSEIGRIQIGNKGKASSIHFRYGKRAAKFLNDILPFLVVKKKQAELCLGIISLLDRSSSPRKLPEKNLLTRIALIDQIKKEKIV